MGEYILARGNGRHIPHEDKIFGISNSAKAMIAEKGADKVINATIGSLLDDDGNLVVLSSVDEVFKRRNMRTTLRSAASSRSVKRYSRLRSDPIVRKATWKR